MPSRIPRTYAPGGLEEQLRKQNKMEKTYKSSHSHSCFRKVSPDARISGRSLRRSRGVSEDLPTSYWLAAERTGWTECLYPPDSFVELRIHQCDGIWRWGLWEVIR